MHHRNLGLEGPSFYLHSEHRSATAISRASMTTASPSHFENPETNQEKDIFQAKTQEEINLNYQKILLTYGQWNADIYLKILNELNTKDEGTIQPVDPCPLPELTKIKCSDTNQTAAPFKHNRAGPLEYENTMNDCKPRTKHLPKSSPVPEDSIDSGEPTYKKIFKNAKLNRKPRYIESLKDILTPLPSSKILEKKLTTVEEPTDEFSVVSKKLCTPVKDEPNNFLLDLRRCKSVKDRKTVSFSSAQEIFMDDIERYFVNKPMQAVLDSNLGEQMEFMKARLKSHVTQFSEVDLLHRDLGYTELKDNCLNDVNSINEFQNMFDDSKWRNKFDLGKIEDSDDADSLDISDAASSESASLCSGDSLGTELDYRPRPIPPSRIPCIAEVRKMGDILFDKISAKWEKAILKNFLDPNIKPLFQHYSHEVRLRSTAPVFSRMLKLLEPYDDVYAKKYVPHRYRMMDKLEKIVVAQKAKNEKLMQLRTLESLQVRRGLGKTSPSPVRYVMQEPTKYQDKNQRQRLKGIMLETKRRGQEGLTDWTKKALEEDYINLKPIIKTKKPHETKCSQTVCAQPRQKNYRPAKKSMSMRSLRNVETSLFLRLADSLSPTSSLTSGLSKRKVTSRSRFRLPI